ncbi:MAG: hypothetical protein E4H40_03095, partial [Candidatus Brocadiia bacterium]
MYQSKNVLSTCLVVLFLIIAWSVPSCASDWKDYTASQYWFKVVPNEGLPITGSLEAYGQLFIATIPAIDLYQPVAYLGLRNGPIFVYGGNFSNWREGTDPFMAGVTLVVPFGSKFDENRRFLFVSEMDIITHPDWTDYYGWFGID